ncbi:MAG: AsmA family protein [Ignavibacteriaceae bacterium]|nr:AsmA family protein [Ignavibacteriaceae bacterium]
MKNPLLDMIPRRSRFHKTVNVFLFFFVGLFLLFMLIGGITQTATFRNYLREQIVSLVNGEINGKIEIGKIDGTIFTSLIVRDAKLLYQQDTIASIRKVEVKISPLQIFLQKIFVRKILIEDASFVLLRDSAGVLNLTKAFPSTPPDTSKTDFPFLIKISEVSLSQINFSLQDEALRNSKDYYENLNLSDLRINNLGLTLNAEVNINDNEFKAHIDDFYCQTNIFNFNIKKIAGDFLVNEEELSALGVELQTNRSNLSLLAQLKGFNLFDTFNEKTFKKAGANVNLIAQPFNFDDLTALVPAVDMLEGNLDGIINAEGTVNNLHVQDINLKYLETDLKCTGRLKNLDTPSNLLIDAAITNSTLTYENVLALMPGLTLPQFQNLSALAVDTLTYKGGIKNFTSRISAGLNEGSVNGDVTFDFRKPEMEYKADVNSFNLDMQPFVHFPVILTSKITAAGAGTDGKTLTSEITIDAARSKVTHNYLSEFLLTGKMKNGILVATCNAAVDSQKIVFDGNLNIQNDNAPQYEFSLDARELNLAQLLGDSLLTSSFNTTFNVSGEGFNPDKLLAKLNGRIYDSHFKQKIINEAWIVFSMDTKDAKEKNITLHSTFADASLTGNFQLTKLIPQLIYESDGISKSFIEKIDTYYPLGIKKDSLIAKTKLFRNTPRKKTEPEEKQNEAFDLNFNVVARDLSLLSILTDQFQLDTDGKLNGKIKSDNSTFSLQASTSFEYLKIVAGEDIYIASNGNAKINLEHPLRDFHLRNFSSAISLNSERIIAASEIKYVAAKITLRNNILKAEANANIGGNMQGSIAFSSKLGSPTLQVNVDTLVYKYNNFELMNREEMQIGFADKILSFKNFNLYRGEASLKAEGTLATEGKQDLSIQLSKFKGYDISYNLFGIKPESIIDNNITISSKITGTFKNPVIDLKVDVDSVSYHRNTFGSLKALFAYKEKNLQMEIKFGEGGKDSLLAKLSVNGSLPLDLAFGAVANRFPDDKELSLAINSKDFDLAAFGDALPFVNELGGILNADILIAGTYAKLNPTGFLKIQDGAFRVAANNLKYTSSFQLHFEDQSLILDNMVVVNSGTVKNKGTLRGSGKMVFKGLKIISNEITVNGDLTVLTNDSKSASPYLYGNLFVGTDGNIVFSMKNEYASLSAPLLIKDAYLILPPAQGTFSSNDEKFIYNYVEDTVKLTSREEEIQRLINAKITKDLNNGNGDGLFSKFDYDILVKIQSEATITFILAKEANQKLTSVLNGSVRYKRENGLQYVQGELKLLEGSTLEFIKTFTATGSLKFESEVTNPYLDIVGMYKNYYVSSDSTSGTGKEEEVAVKIKLVGPLKELSKTFAQSETNMAVYRGSSAIINDQATPGLDKSDAIWFIISGKFKNEVTSQDKTKASDMFSGTATSFAGSLVGGALNTYLGDVVKSLEFRSSGNTTKLNLSGRINKFKYTIGGTTNIFQDLSTANILIEYPLLENFVVRVERKLSETENTFTTEMINELGLKYKFEF